MTTRRSRETRGNGRDMISHNLQVTREMIRAVHDILQPLCEGPNIELSVVLQSGK